MANGSNGSNEITYVENTKIFGQANNTSSDEVNFVTVKSAKSASTSASTKSSQASVSAASSASSPQSSLPQWMKDAMMDDGRIAVKGSKVGIKVGKLHDNSLSLGNMIKVAQSYQKKLSPEQINFEKRPSPAMLRKNFECIAFAKSADGATIDLDFTAILYNNGWVEYWGTGRHTTLKLTDCLNFTYYYNVVIDEIDRTVLDKSLLENENWVTCVCLAGEERITASLNRHSDAIGIGTSEESKGAAGAAGVADNEIEDDDKRRQIREPVTVVRIPTPEERFLAQERRDEIRAIISRAQSMLTVKQAELYKLHFEYDIPLLRVSEILRVTPGACTHRIESIQEQFCKQIIDKTGEDVDDYLNIEFSKRKGSRRVGAKTV